MNKYKIFCIIMVTVITITALSSIYNHGKSIGRILFGDSNDTYMDFYNSMMYKKEPYQNKVIYPPLANVIYYIISEFIPRKDFSKGSFAIRSSQMGRFIGGIYIAFSYLLFAYAVIKMKKGKIEEQMLLTMLLALSTPFIFQLERGNIIFLTCSFVMLYLYGYKSQNTLKKHLSFICLSIAAAFKIYPAIFGFLLLKEKRWKDAGICVLYGISIFILPIIFLGGFSKFPLFIHNIINASSELGIMLPNSIQLSITNFCNTIAYYTKIEEISYISSTVTMVVLFTGLLIILFSDFKEKWKTPAVACSLMISIPSFSFIYAMIFITIPLIIFLDEENTSHDKLFLTLFLLMLLPIPVRFTGYVESIALLSMMAILWCEGLTSIWQKAKQKILQTRNQTNQIDSNN